MTEFKSGKVGGVEVSTYDGRIHIRVCRSNDPRTYAKVMLRPDQALTAANGIIDALEHLKKAAG